MIYVFIAASYFPWVMLRPLPQDSLAAELWWLVWEAQKGKRSSHLFGRAIPSNQETMGYGKEVLAAAGILYQQMFHERYKTLETCFYIFLGAAPSLAVLAHIEHAEFAGIQELMLGGALYAIGVCFFKSDGVVPCAHAIWHMFVGTAATVHYYAILHHLYTTPSV
ncbi:hypothetical protein J6590_057533 [Homalodisca vitripennis]|nr:hypothetical protein J6590_057533 [Homalodisca vitripennis]